MLLHSGGRNRDFESCLWMIVALRVWGGIIRLDLNVKS